MQHIFSSDHGLQADTLEQHTDIYFLTVSPNCTLLLTIITTTTGAHFSPFISHNVMHAP